MSGRQRRANIPPPILVPLPVRRRLQCSSYTPAAHPEGAPIGDSLSPASPSFGHLCGGGKPLPGFTGLRAPASLLPAPLVPR